MVEKGVKQTSIWGQQTKNWLMREIFDFSDDVVDDRDQPGVMCHFNDVKTFAVAPKIDLPQLFERVVRAKTC